MEGVKMSKMKSLNKYTDELQSILFDENGAFFAFSKSQFDESKVDEVKYIDVGAGLICPVDNAQTVINGVNNIHEKAVKKRLNDYDLSRIIQYELANYECQISMDYSDAFDVLKDYGVDQEMMDKEWKIYWEHCVKNDLF